MYILTAYAKHASRWSRRVIAGSLAGTAITAMAAAAFISSPAQASARAPALAEPATAAKGDVDVISAGSLNTLMKKIAPAFHAATGYTLSDIKNGVYVEDVFVSASPTVDKTLEGRANGSWVSWYADFAASPEVLGYDPKSTFATDLRTMPWYKVITMSGFRLGRTDPSQDPGGVLAEKALKETAKAEPTYASALNKLASESSDVYPEDTEQADIQTGQLDGSFMYEADANSQDSPFVKLTGVSLAGDYTITLLKNAPHPGAADAFIKFLLGSKGQAAMKADHFEIVSPAQVSGSGVPSALKPLLK
jgi:molybdate/tungstate transport system substrate-binding protein